MALIPWKPFGDLEKWLGEGIPDIWEWPEIRFPKLPSVRVPRMDIYEKGNNVVAEVELPGVKAEDISVEVKDNVLDIEERSEEEKEEKKKGYYRKESGERYFRRQATLPTDVIGDKAEAEYADGVLTVTIPKAKPKAAKEKKIKVKAKTKGKGKAKK